MPTLGQGAPKNVGTTGPALNEPLATVETLKAMIGIENDVDDQILGHSLQSAHTWVCGRVFDDHILYPDVQQAILMLASRLFKRRQSPEGVSGFNEYGIVRVMREDPDIFVLLEHHLDTYDKTFGLA